MVSCGSSGCLASALKASVARRTSSGESASAPGAAPSDRTLGPGFGFSWRTCRGQGGWSRLCVVRVKPGSSQGQARVKPEPGKPFPACSRGLTRVTCQPSPCLNPQGKWNRPHLSLVLASSWYLAARSRITGLTDSNNSWPGAANFNARPNKASSK